jgi:hypothetical protein
METVQLSVLFYEEGDVWVAQAIEADIVATASRLALLPRAIERAIIANMAANIDLGRNGLEGIPPAPPEVRERFEKSTFEFRERHPDPRPRKVGLSDIRLAA